MPKEKFSHYSNQWKYTETSNQANPTTQLENLKPQNLTSRFHEDFTHVVSTPNHLVSNSNNFVVEANENNQLRNAFSVWLNYFSVEKHFLSRDFGVRDHTLPVELSLTRQSVRTKTSMVETNWRATFATGIQWWIAQFPVPYTISVSTFPPPLVCFSVHILSFFFIHPLPFCIFTFFLLPPKLLRIRDRRFACSRPLLIYRVTVLNEEKS